MEIKELAQYLSLSEPEAKMLDERAKQLGLDPVSGQIHLLKRRKNEGGKWVTVYSFMIGIEGFRLIAERSCKYDGQDQILFSVLREEKLIDTPVVLDTDVIVSATAYVYKKGIKRPFVNTAHLRDYAQTKDDGKVTAIWKKATIMLPKCAEAGAFRKGFPDLGLGDTYEPSEIPPDEPAENGGKCVASELEGQQPPWVAFPPSTAPAPKTDDSKAPAAPAPKTDDSKAPAAPAPKADDSKAPVAPANEGQKKAIIQLAKRKGMAEFDPLALGDATFEWAKKKIIELSSMPDAA